MALPTLAGLKAHLNITASTSDTELATFLAAARKMIEAHTGPLAPTSVTEVVDGRPSAWVLSARPVVSVDSATGTDDSRTATLASLAIDGPAGVVRSAADNLSGSWSVTYTAGMASVPENVELAVYVTAQHLWKTQRGGGQRPGQGTDPVGSTVGYALPYMAIELLGGNDSELGFA